MNTEPPPGSGHFEGVRRVEFRVLVSPRCTNARACPALCEAAHLGETACPDDDAIQFRLATANGVSLESDVLVQDLCPNTEVGPKYFHVLVDDLGAIDSIAGASPGEFVDVFFQGKGTLDPETAWADIGPALHMANYPASFDRSFWRGHFDPAEATYHFEMRSSEQTEQTFDPGKSMKIDILGVAEIPEKENLVGSGFVARFGSTANTWFAERGTGTASGVVLSNTVDSGPIQVDAEEVVSQQSLQGGGSGGGLGSLEDLRYEWCRNEEILRNEFKESLFEAVIYSGFIGPLPVTIHASIGLGLKYLVESQVSVFVEPLKELEGGGGHTLEQHFYLLSKVGISIPCEARADLLFGVGNVTVGVIPNATFELDTHVVTEDAAVDPKLFVQALFSLTMFVEGCIDILLAEICASVEFPIVENVELLPTQGCCPKPLITCEPGQETGGDYPNCQHADQSQSPCTSSFFGVARASATAAALASSFTGSSS